MARGKVKFTLRIFLMDSMKVFLFGSLSLFHSFTCYTLIQQLSYREMMQKTLYKKNIGKGKAFSSHFGNLIELVVLYCVFLGCIDQWSVVKLFSMVRLLFSRDAAQ